MKWLDYSQRCDKELQTSFGDTPDLHQLAHSLHLIPNALANLEDRTNDALDRAAIQFSEKLTWPHLMLDERTMMAFRLECGASVAFLLSNLFSAVVSNQTKGRPILIPEPSLDVPTEHIWRWLLIEAWDSHGFPTLLDTTERLVVGVTS